MSSVASGWTSKKDKPGKQKQILLMSSWLLSLENGKSTDIELTIRPEW